MISLWGENSNISVSYGVHMCKHFVWLLTHLKKVTWCQWCLQRCGNGRVRNSWAKVFSLFYFSTVTVIAVLKVEASWLIESGTYLRLCHQRGVRAGDCPTVLPTRTRASCSPPPPTLSLSTQVFLSAICLWVHLLVYEDRCLPLAPHPCNPSMATLILPQRLRLPGPGRYMYSFPR